MKAIIEVSDKSWETMKNYLPFKSEPITLPDNATNGDVLKALFPYSSVIIDGDHIVFAIENRICLRFPIDWWNAPYRKEQNNGNSKVDD